MSAAAPTPGTSQGAPARGPRLPPAVERELRAILDPDGLITAPDALLVYETDALPSHRATPRAVLLPRTHEAVIACVRVLGAAGIPFAPRGAGTGLSGGAIALHDGVVLSVARLNRIISLDPANRVATVEAGVVNARLNAAARPHGLRYAPDPSSEPVCTIGGNIAENSGGPHCLKYGVTLNHVLGLTVVLPDGAVVRLGGAAREHTGCDLLGLFIGSEGTFGIATEAEVRLTPLPDAVETLLAMFDDVNDASRAVSAIIAAGLLPAALEMVDRQGILAVESSVYGAGMPTDIDGALVIEFDGPAAGPAEDAERARAICLAHGAREVRRAMDEAERSRLWHARKKAYGAMGRLAPDLLVQDGTVPRSRLPETMARIYEIARAHGLRISNTFHAGDGNLHPKILFDRRQPDAIATVARASKAMMQACVDAGGTITGEHGVGLDKREYMRLIHGPAELALMRAVRDVFDPRGLANPGKILPAETPVPAQGNPRNGARSADTHAGPARRHGAPAGTPRPEASPEESLRAVLGDDAVRPGSGTAYRVRGRVPAAVVAPADAEQAAAALRVAAENGWVVKPAGAGGWLDAGGVGRVDVVLTAERLVRVLEYEPADLMIGVEAGLPLADLADRLRPHAQFFPVEPPATTTATVGAVIATGAAGPLRLGHGTPRDHVLGLQLVTGDGTVLELGGRVVKNVAGYDLVRLLVGSHGSLGFVTRAFLRLRPRPATDVTAVFLADHPAELVATALGLNDGWPVAAELIDPATAASLGQDERWCLAVRWQGNESFARFVAGALRGCPLANDVIAADAATKLWTGLNRLEARATASFRLTGLPDRLPLLLEASADLMGAAALSEIDRSENGLVDPAGPAWRIAAHARSGIVRVWSANAGADHVDRLRDRLLRVRQALATPGSVVAPVQPPGRDEGLEQQPDVVGGPADRSMDAGSDDSRRAALADGLRTVFDPAGVLGARRFPPTDAGSA